MADSKGPAGKESDYAAAEAEAEAEVEVEEGAVSGGITKIGKNARRIEHKVGVKASLDTIWDVLTDYERWSEFVPGIAESKVISRKDNVARVCQISRDKLPLGMKFDSKFILEYAEKDVETFSSGKKRELEFKMIESNLQLYEGKFSIQQLINKERYENGDESTLSFSVDVKPKIWIPINLVENMLSNNLKANVMGLKREAEKKT